jgi:hypothetical protein
MTALSILIRSQEWSRRRGQAAYLGLCFAAPHNGGVGVAANANGLPHCRQRAVTTRQTRDWLAGFVQNTKPR